MLRGVGLGGFALLLLACTQNDDPGWRAHPCPPHDDYEDPPSVLVLDGSVDDWTSVEHVVTDGRGDATGAFDLVDVSASNRGTDLYVSFTIDRVLNLYQGDPDDGTLRLELRLPDGRHVSVDFRDRTATLGSGGVVSWQALGLVAAPSHASDTFEVRLDMSAFAAQPGALVELGFSGSDSLEEPVTVPVRYGPSSPLVVDVDRPADASLRMASLNTREAGLFDVSRSKALGRILRASGADVYALQELGSVDGEMVEQAFGNVVPPPPGSRWYAHAAGRGAILGNAVVAKHPLLPIPLDSERALGAVVLDPEGAVAILSVHLKCCGFQGTEEDALRLREVEHLAHKIVSFRLGELGEDLRPHADVPLVVAGDFNHVGSPGLVADLASPRSLGLRRAVLPHVGSPDVFTWVGYESAFPPATLDLLLYDDLDFAGGFVLDTEDLTRGGLERFGLWGSDSRASDHLLLVADFR
jgi:endonuclease/exonuclease/phosphatase family metal-dependent hydrolase